MPAFSFTVSGGGGIAGGSSPQIQFNNSGVLGGATNFEFDAAGAAVRGLSGLTGGYRLFSTADVTTNFERLSLRFVTPWWQLASQFGGTGVVRGLKIGYSTAAGTDINTFLQIGQGPFFTFSRASALLGDFINLNDGLGATLSFLATAGVQVALNLNPSALQSGTAGYTCLKINPTGTFGSGQKLLIDAQSANVSRYQLNDLGVPRYIPSATQTLIATNAITVNAGHLKVQGSGGAVTLTSVPTIAAGLEGEVIFIVGQSNTNTVTLQDRGTLAGSNLRLAAATRVLGLGDVLRLVFDGTLWSEMSFTNNL